MTHTLSNELVQFGFDRETPPVLSVTSGSTVAFETGSMVLDRLVAGEPPEKIGLERLNAVSGPIEVSGAEPGDALRIEVLGIDIAAAWSVWMPGFGPLGPQTSEVRARRTPIRDGRVYVSDELSVALDPMIGCIGLAPAEGVGSTLRPVLRTGGNMDLRELSPGATIWLPVEVAGALLSVGDLHAAMGQGEPTAVALEAHGTATLRIHLEKHAAPPTPRLRAGNETIIVGLAETHPEARAAALQQAFDLLVTGMGMEPFDAYAYASAAVGVTLGGPASAMVLARVPDPI